MPASFPHASGDSDHHLIIFTSQGDTHAEVVVRAWHALGGIVTTIDTRELLNAAPRCLLLGAGLQGRESGAGSHQESVLITDWSGSGEGVRIWLRRTGLAHSNLGDPADRRFAEREAECFWQSALAVIWPRGFWVNHPQAARRAERKAWQLQEAANAGWRIPRTLMGNDPEQIRAFVAALGGCAVYKPFAPFNWEQEGDRLAIHAQLVTLAQLEDTTMLRAAPGIYQEPIRKAADVRVTVFGRCIVAVEIGGDLPAGSVDWKAIPSQRLRIRPVRLPHDVEEGIRRLMQLLDLRFGCLDLIRTPENEWVFLEINEAGQFLWLEEACPELPMLAHFCGLLWEADAGFPGAGEAFRRSLRLENFRKPKREEAPA